MIRTQISLEPEEVSWLRREAKIRGTSLAGVLRELIRHATQKDPTRRPAAQKRAARHKGVSPKFPFVACIKDGPATDAKLAEDYLYGEGEVE